MKKNLIYFFTLMMLSLSLVSCNDNKKQSANVITFGSDAFVKVDVDLDSKYYDSVFSLVSQPRIVALKENDETMFADLDKLIVRDGKYFVLDAYGSRTVVSFNADGTPLAKYGKVGQGPGEYFRPVDIDVFDDIVYVLDMNTQKLMKYKESGELIDEISTPFRAEAINVVNRNKYLFCLYLQEESAKKGHRICVTDSNLQVVATCLPIKEGYISGFINNDALRTGSNGIAYYKIPCDTMFEFDDGANPRGGIVFDFGSFAVPDLAHVDFVKVMDDDRLKGTRMFTDTPISLAGGYMAVTHDEDSRNRYTVLFNPATNRCGGKRYKDMDSVYDILEPLAADEKGNLISYAALEDLQEKKGYDELPDSVKAQLENNNRILLIYPFSKLSDK